MYSDSALLSEIYVCSDLHQQTGHLEYIMTIKVLDIILSESSPTSRNKPRTKSSSTQHSRPFDMSGLYIMHYFLVRNKYLPIRLIKLICCRSVRFDVLSWKSLDGYYLTNSLAYQLPFGSSMPLCAVSHISPGVIMV